MGNSEPTLTNCIFWGNSSSVNNYDNSNPTYSFSLVQGLNPVGTGNLDGTNPDNDPHFISQPDFNTVPTVSGDLRLQPCSPAINIGENASVPSGITTDRDGNPRFYNSGTVDTGAFEYQGAAASDPVVYVNDDASGNNDGTSWTDAFTDLQDAVTLAKSCSNISEIWAAEGTYKPSQGPDGTTDSQADFTFYLDFDVKICGGFPNSGNPGMNDRDRLAHPTILSGDINGDDGGIFENQGDNVYNVI